MTRVRYSDKQSDPNHRGRSIDGEWRRTTRMAVEEKTATNNRRRHSIAEQTNRKQIINYF